MSKLKRLAAIEKKIQKLQEETKQIQTSCTHPPQEVCYRYDASTGNFCRSDDCYWTDIHCGMCGKRWQEDGSKSMSGLSTRVRNQQEFLDWKGK